jgi:hypothetical protein
MSVAALRHYHMLFEEQAIEILAMADEIVERVRNSGGPLGDIGRHQRLGTTTRLSWLRVSGGPNYATTQALHCMNATSSGCLQ